VIQASLDTGLPVSFGLLTTDTLEQAAERAGGQHGNKGAEAADAAVEMAQLMRALPRGRRM
jgi:6,7-dimethyl-8-ribityllumazine synthase